jgi:hypothetical protein
LLWLVTRDFTASLSYKQETCAVIHRGIWKLAIPFCTVELVLFYLVIPSAVHMKGLLGYNAMQLWESSILGQAGSRWTNSAGSLLGLLFKGQKMVICSAKILGCLQSTWCYTPEGRYLQYRVLYWWNALLHIPFDSLVTNIISLLINRGSGFTN